MLHYVLTRHSKNYRPDKIVMNNSPPPSVLSTLAGDKYAEITRSILEPLCPKTAEFLKPLPIRTNDRLSIGIDSDGRKFYLRGYAILNDKEVQPSFAVSQFFKRLLEKAMAHNGVIECGATDLNCLIINACWASSQIVFEDSLAQAKYVYLLNRFLSTTLASKIRADYKTNKLMPPTPEDFLDSSTKPLSNYQRVALFTGAKALFMQQGTGKTPIIVRKICEKAREHYERELIASKRENRIQRPYYALIVCPRNVRNNWKREFQEFTTVRGRVTPIRGTKVERLTLTANIFVPDPNIYFSVGIISYDSIDRSWDILQFTKWDLIAADESHYFKSSRTRRWRAMKNIRENAQERMVLTGTPITNSVLDLYTQLEFIEEGASGFTSFKAFSKFYGVWDDPSGSGFEKLVGMQNVPFMQERLAREAMIITKEEAMPEMPEKVYTIIEVELTDEQKVWYQAVQNKLKVEIEGKDLSDKMTTNHILTQMLRLAQITSGFVTVDPKIDANGNVVEAGRIVPAKKNPKLEQLKEILLNLGAKEKAIVWGIWNADIAAIANMCKANNIPYVTFTGATNDAQRIIAEDRFNKTPANECKVFIGNPAAGGAGLNLRGYDPAALSEADWVAAGRRGVLDHGCNCTTVIYYSQDWSMTKRAQSEDRAHRRGTRTNVTYIDLVVPNTIDTEIRDVVAQKRVNADQIQNLQEIFQRLLSVFDVEDDAPDNTDLLEVEKE